MHSMRYRDSKLADRSRDQQRSKSRPFGHFKRIGTNFVPYQFDSLGA